MKNKESESIQWGWEKGKPSNMRSKKHQEFLINQYNRNRPIEEQVSSMQEYIKALENNDVKHHGMRSVTISTRQVYHKYAEVTIEIPKDIPNDKVGKWLWNNEDKYTDQMDKNLSKSDYEFGFGIEDHRGMNEDNEETEWRYDINGENYGGHI